MKQQVADFYKHFAFVRVAKINKKIFIPNFLNDLLSVPLRFIILLIIWTAIYAVSGRQTIGGYTLWSMIFYYVMYTTVLHITSYYRQLPYAIWDEITKGNMSKYICRPISYIQYHFFYGLGYAYYSSIFCVPIIIVLSLYFFDGSYFWKNCALFIVSLVLGIAITYFVYLLIGLLTFWTESIFGFRDMILHIGAIFSGSVLPMSFFPSIAQTISLFLPFRYMIYDPISILIYQLPTRDILFIMLRQLICLAVLVLVARLVWALGIKRYEAQGG